MTKFSYLVLFLCCSCTSFINNFDESLLKSDRTLILKKNENNFCKSPSSTIFMGDNPKAQNNFSTFIESQSQKKFSFEDKIVLWALIQMKLRPDLASPNAGIQFFIISERFEKKYYHVFSKDPNSFSLFHALENILKKGSHYSLQEHIINIDSNYKFTLAVSQNFSSYLFGQKDLLKANEVLSKKYLRGDENLKQGERLQNYNLQKVYKEYKKSKATYLTQNKLFSYKRNQTNIQCNYNLDSYEKSIFSIHNTQIKGHSFAITQGKNTFLAITNIEYLPVSDQKNPDYFLGDSLTKPSGFCHIDGKFNMALFSNSSRDPAQHLFHTIKYEIGQAKTIEDISSIIDYPRYLVLENPKRIIFESTRSSEEHIQNLLKLNIPIYNSYSLGNISGAYYDQKQNGVFVDSRSNYQIKCLK